MSSTDLIEFGKRLAEVRRQLKVMQKEFAATIGVSSSTLSLMETGKTKPGYGFFRNIIDKYNVNPVYLFTGKGEKFLSEESLNSGHKKDYGEFAGMFEELYFYLENSPLAKFAVMDFFLKYKFNNQEALDEDLEKYKKIRQENN